MLRDKKIPTKPRFDKARKHAYDLLLRLGIEAFPVEPLIVRDYFPNISIVSYTELQKNTGEADPFNFDKKNAKINAINAFILDPKDKLSPVDGITVVKRGTTDYLIVYDDRIGNEQRIRWTIAHELGHIFCGHLLDFEETALNRGGLTKKEYGVLEVEANWFVSEFLSPRAVLGVFTFEKPSEIALLCDISKAASIKRFKQIKNGEFSYGSNEVLRNFWNHLVTGEFQKVIYNNLCEYVYAPFYNELADVCHICRNCGTVIESSNAKFCYNCGKESVVDASHHMAMLDFSDITGTNVIFPQVPFSFEGTGGKGTSGSRLSFCPVCKNSESSDNACYCLICGSSLVNICGDCFNELPVAYRYCPDCGYESTFKPLYEHVYKPKPIVLPDEYDDYIEYYYWEFIRLTIGYWDEKDKTLYACLSDSVAFRDDGNFIIVTPHRQLVGFISDNLNKVKENIVKYGKTVIDLIQCMYVEEG